MPDINLPYVCIDSAGGYRFTQDGSEVRAIESITTEQTAELGPSFIRYTITGLARVGSEEARVYWTKDENGEAIPTNPDYRPR